MAFIYGRNINRLTKKRLGPNREILSSIITSHSNFSDETLISITFLILRSNGALQTREAILLASKEMVGSRWGEVYKR